jgi:hypothetical protein
MKLQPQRLPIQRLKTYLEAAKLKVRANLALNEESSS